MQNRIPIAPEDIVIPAFTPVPRKYRFDGWTAERQRAFIDALADTGSVRAAAKRINMSSEGAYYLRRQPGAESFRAAWDAALDHGVQRLADIALDRAREGVAVPVFWRGEQIGEKRWFNDRLLMFLLKHHMPNRYGADLPRGTRHPETIAREAAANCPVCRKRRERKATPPDGAEQQHWLDELLTRYAAKVRSERHYRLTGQTVAADYTVRQLTHIELILDLGGRSGALIDLWSRRPPPEGSTTHRELFASDLSLYLDTLRRAEWAKMGDPPRPPLDLRETLPGSFLCSGADRDEREKARKEAEAAMAAAQRKWEAAATEEGWAAWREEQSGGGVPDRSRRRGRSD